MHRAPRHPLRKVVPFAALLPMALTVIVAYLGTVLFTLTGIHATHVLSGIVILALVLKSARSRASRTVARTTRKLAARLPESTVET